MFLIPLGLLAQLTPEQRVQDFQNLTALYAKRYAPYEWKRDAIKFDLYDTGPWLDRIRKAKDDLEFYEIALEYVARLQDTHSRYLTPSSFTADLSFTVDIYDDKVLIESINRARLAAAQFPFQIGDEVVSVDGKTAEELIAAFSRFRQWGNPRTTRRSAADAITFRAQSAIPRAVELGDTATVVIRRANGNLETYAVPWFKMGAPLTVVGPVPSPRTGLSSQLLSRQPLQVSDAADYMRALTEMRNWSVSMEEPVFRGEGETPDGEPAPRRWLLGLGGRTPIFRAGFPANFIQRLGFAPIDFHFSGVYESGGFKIGFLRVPNFGPNPATVIRELETEIDYFQKNTDGLVIDVMRNPGGGCYMADLAAHLIPHDFYFFGEQLRVTLDRINSLQFSIEAARRAGADQWIIDTYQLYLDALKQAYRESRGLTGSVAACNQLFSGFPPNVNQQPARVVYTKPLIILVDEFSISAADIFPSMMQDNGRGVLVGMRTSGGGGSVSGWPAGFYSEAISLNTNSLVLRKQPIATAEYPTAPYVENIGARPDITLDYMTRQNLLMGGRPFVDEFTRIIVAEIAKAR